MKKRILIIPCLVFLLAATAQLQALVLGDANSDGNINVVDALMTAQSAVGLAPAGFSAANADVNNNSGTDILDALMIAQYAVGLIRVFPPNDNTLDPRYRVIRVPVLDDALVLTGGGL